MYFEIMWKNHLFFFLLLATAVIRKSALDHLHEINHLHYIYLHYLYSITMLSVASTDPQFTNLHGKPTALT